MKEIRLSCGKVCLVDDENYEELSKLKWSSSGYGYARTALYTPGIFNKSGWLKQRVVKMHRMIMNAKEKEHVDHINGNPLDNRKENLRVCTACQNLANQKLRKDSTTGYKGVCASKVKINPWRAYVNKKIDGKSKQHHLGFFKTKEEAALAYNEKAKELFGEFARLNIIK